MITKTLFRSARPQRAAGSGLVVVAVLTLGAAATPALAQDGARMAQVVSARASEDGFSGSVLVARNGEVLLQQAEGFANLEWGVRNDGDTKFRLGSLTKQFTAVAVLLLRERGQLDLEGPVKTWLPDAPSAWDAVTVRQLLSHTAGIPDFTRLEEYEARKTAPTTTGELLARFRDLPLAFTPGEKFAYSNSNYVVLTAIIEAASGQPYADFVEANLFGPLAMADSGYDRAEAILPRRAAGYAVGADGPVNAGFIDMSVPAGAGGLYSTTHDLLKWEEGLFGGRLLRPESLALLTTPVRGGYALGLLATQADGRTLVWHNGAVDGFRSYMAYDPAARTAVIVLGNQEGDVVDKLGNDLATLSVGGSVTLPSERRAIALAPETLRQYEGVFELAPTFALTVFLQDGHLMVQATNQAPAALSAEGEDAFYLTVVDARITFTRNAEGAVDGAVLHQGGRDMPARRRPGS
ncbi:serine hydrolase [Brevundimonas sp.]|jgi:CubicO group peptidase (beta-lactamase class C family)|uniref:serine hydrolase n=1 Tax=Brevundimonas sp. TaxID=1871086 RepID=UPI0037BE8E1A